MGENTPSSRQRVRITGVSVHIATCTLRGKARRQGPADFLRSFIKAQSNRITEGKLEAKLPTIWTDRKAQPGRSSAMEKDRSEKIRDGESQKGEDAGARKGRESREKLCFSNVLWLRKVGK